jgi:hypothetical protein
MAAVTQLDQVKTTAAGNKSTAAVAVALGDLIIVVAHNSGRTTAQPPTISDNNPVAGTYTQVFSATKNTSADSQWWFVRNSPIKNTTTTTFTSTQSGDTGGGLIVFKITGMERFGPAAFRQTGKQDNAATGTPSITLGKAIMTENPCIGIVHTGQSGTTNTAPPTGWSETGDSGYGTPPTGVEQVKIDSGSTLTTVAWTAATTSGFSSTVAEFDSSHQRKVDPYRQLMAH